MPLVLEQPQVGGGEIADGREPAGPRGTVPAGVDGDQDAHGAGQVVGDALHGDGAAAVQDQRGAAGPGLGHGDADRPAGAEVDGAASGHHSLLYLAGRAA